MTRKKLLSVMLSVYLSAGLILQMARIKEVYAWLPQAGPQTEFSKRGEFEGFYGGAAGGGKSDALLGEALRGIEHPDYRGIIFRRTFPELSQGGGLIDRSQSIYRPIGGTWLEGKREWHFPTGAVIQFRHMEHEHTKYNYQGGQFQYIGFDELTQFLESQYVYLISRARSSNPNLRPIVRSASNPGGIGHLWVKTRFVDNGAYKTFIDPESGRSRTFIPARVWDNEYFNPKSEKCVDPNYVKNLMLLPEEERKMLLEGDWDVYQGQYFHKFRRWLHVIQPFLIPSDYQWGYGIDFGLNDPFVWIEGAVGFDSQIYGEMPTLYITREYTGREKSPQANARECVIRMKDKKYEIGVVGKDAKKRLPQREEADSEVTIMDLLADAGLDELQLANNDRKQGWTALTQLLEWEGDQEYVSKMPLIRIFDTCTNLINTIPALPRDENDPDDVDKKSTDDHWAEALRYLIMSLYPLHRIKDRHIEKREDRWRRKFTKTKTTDYSEFDRGYLL